MDSAWAGVGDDREWQRGAGAGTGEDVGGKMEELERSPEVDRAL